MLVVHVLSVLLGLVAGLELVILVHAVGLGELIDLACGKASEDFFGQGVFDGLACGEAVLVHARGTAVGIG